MFEDSQHASNQSKAMAQAIKSVMQVSAQNCAKAFRAWALLAALTHLSAGM